jgi:hypothetical protein
MVYAIFLCTYVAGMPQVSNCQLVGSVEPSLVIFDNKQKCEQTAAQRNTVWHDTSSATVRARYVCLERPPADRMIQ